MAFLNHDNRLIDMNMHSESKESRCRLEVIKWVIVTLLLTIAIVGNYYYRDSPTLLRSLTVALIIIAAGAMALITTIGKGIVTFARESRIEVRKVVWPTRHETLRTTLIVATVTAVMSMILWGLDGILVSLISFITSLRF